VGRIGLGPLVGDEPPSEELGGVFLELVYPLQLREDVSVSDRGGESLARGPRIGDQRL